MEGSKMMDPNRPTSEDVKLIRTSRGWSQAKFAERIGVSQATVSKIESGETPSEYFLEKMKENLFKWNVVKTFGPPKYEKPSFLKRLKLRLKYEFGMYDKSGIRPMTFDAFVHQTLTDEASRKV